MPDFQRLTKLIVKHALGTPVTTIAIEAPLFALGLPPVRGASSFPRTSEMLAEQV